MTAAEFRVIADAFGPDHPRTRDAFEERTRTVLAEEEADKSQHGVWYLSFVDTNIAATIPLDQQRPGGASFLGGCYIEAFGILHASHRAAELGCNPGGAVAAYGPLNMADAPDDIVLGKLYTAAELGYPDPEGAEE